MLGSGLTTVWCAIPASRNSCIALMSQCMAGAVSAPYGRTRDTALRGVCRAALTVRKVTVPALSS